MLKKLERYLHQIISGRNNNGLSLIIKVMMLPLSWLYQIGVICRNYLYDRGWMRRYVPPVPVVISIGNIVAGGTGKTPVTIMLAQLFYQKYKLGIISRGYRSKAEKLDAPTMLCNGSGPLYEPSFSGDEPYLIAERFPRSTVIVGANRQKSSYLAAKEGVQIILLDDALQHRKLARDFDIVVMDINDPFGKDYFLPRGFLRDEKSSLSRANLVILNHVKNFEKLEEVKKQILKYTQAPIIGTEKTVTGFFNLENQEIPLETLKNQKFGMCCAIAKPEIFKETIQEMGLEVVKEYILPDHHEIEEKNLEKFAQTCLKNEVKWIICTEKDKVKFHNQLNISLPIIWVKIELNIVEGSEEFQAFIKKVEAKINTNIW